MFIGITSRISYDNEIKDLKKYHINEYYLQQIKNLGYYPLILTLDNTDSYLLSKCVGFIIAGGNDISPTIYNQEINGAKNIIEELDELDKVVYDYAKSNNMPLLGICRGLQFINAYSGGTLHQDIKNHTNQKHLIYKKADTKLANLLKNEFEVNTLHHQAINNLAEGFISTYQSGDGYIELIEHHELKIFACQWHPEMMPNDDSTKIIFNYFKELIEVK